MSSATSLDLQIVNRTNLHKIENFLNSSVYQENLEYSSNFNTRLCVERRMRLPFFDPQTGVAQNQCQLFMTKRQRMPGFRDGQIYSYPATRWRKHRRQYLSRVFRPFGTLSASTTTSVGTSSNTSVVSKRVVVEVVPPEVDSDFNGASFIEEHSPLGGGTGDTSDSKDSQNNKDELPKEWLFYDEMDINGIDSLEEPKSPADDEYDYDPRYGNKKRRRRKPSRKSMLLTPHVSEGPRKGRPPGGGVSGGRGRGRRKAAAKDKKYSVDPPSPSIVEPPSFASVAAAVELANDDSASGDLRSYRKYI